MIDFYFDQAGFQNVIKCGTVNYFDGWVVSHDEKLPVTDVVFQIETRTVESLKVRKERPDLEKIYRQSSLGFSGVIQVREEDRGRTLTVSARRSDGTMIPMRKFPLLETLSPEEKNYRQEQMVPDDLLMYLVVHNVDPKSFLEEGRAGVALVKRVLEKEGIELSSLGSILDFGVGCGRVIRWWKDDATKVNLFGTDINPLLVDWCRKNLSFASFSVNTLHPPTGFADNTFGLVYAFSVFTHLAYDTQVEWLREYYRIIAPKKYLLLSVHGDYHAKMLSPEIYAKYIKSGFYVLSSVAEGENMCATYQSTQVNEMLFSEHFEIISYLPQALNACGNQDLYLLKSRKIS